MAGDRAPDKPAALYCYTSGPSIVLYQRLLALFCKAAAKPFQGGYFIDAFLCGGTGLFSPPG